MERFHYYRNPDGLLVRAQLNGQFVLCQIKGDPITAWLYPRAEWQNFLADNGLYFLGEGPKEITHPHLAPWQVPIKKQ
jgi:hypothetical protein